MGLCLQLFGSSDRRKEVLSRGRALLLADYHNCMLASGDARDDNPASAGRHSHQRSRLTRFFLLYFSHLYFFHIFF